MNVFNWFKKSPIPVPPKPKPSIHLEFNNENATIYIECNWKKTESDAEALDVSKSLATMIFMMNTGGLLQSLNESLQVAGNNLNDSRIAALTMAFIDEAYRLRKAGPVVPPRMAFTAR